MLLTSGYLRNRFHLYLTSGLKFPGFVFDESRVPGTEIDNGLGVTAGSYLDPNCNSALYRFDVPVISGKLYASDYRVNLIKGQPLLVGGIGYVNDLKLSGVDLNGSSWNPVVEPGVFFTPEKQAYLYGDNAIEIVISGSDLRYNLPSKPEDFTPIALNSFYVDHELKRYYFDEFKYKVIFTSTNNTPTVASEANTNPPLYNITWSGIRWQNVDTSRKEFGVDRSLNQVIRNQNIVSGVNALLTRVPWSQTHYQLPLIPAVSVSGIPVIKVYNDEVVLVSGRGRLALSGVGTVSNVLTVASGYVRTSGQISDTAGKIRVTPTPSWFPTSGNLLIDGANNRREIVGYSTIINGNEFSGLRRPNPMVHYDSTPVFLIRSGIYVSGTISGVNASGTCLVSYNTTCSTYSLDNITGQMIINPLSGVSRADVELTYYRGLLLTYQPSGTENKYTGSIDINPIENGSSHGILWASLYELIPSRINLTTNKQLISGLYGPVYAGNDFAILTAEVLDSSNSCVPGCVVELSLESNNVGLIDGFDPSVTKIQKTTDATGKARFVYTPPQNIEGLGYFTKVANIVNSSGLVFANEFPFSEIYSNGSWNNLTFAIWDDDEYNEFSETEGIFGYSATGRFELVSRISTAGSPTSYTIFEPVVPAAAYDVNGVRITTSGDVKTLVYQAGAIPTSSGIKAFFISVDRQISIGALTLSGHIASQSVPFQISIPPFMKGEFMFGPIDDPDTKALDALTYLTINPFRNPHLESARLDPRTLGNVFRIEGTKSNEYLRNKFYVIPNWLELANTPDGRVEINKIFGLRNRFILEI
jgi:hypothetical protein